MIGRRKLAATLAARSEGLKRALENIISQPVKSVCTVVDAGRRRAGRRAKRSADAQRATNEARKAVARLEGRSRSVVRPKLERNAKEWMARCEGVRNRATEHMLLGFDTGGKRAAAVYSLIGLCKFADERPYRAKHEGHNCVVAA